jgi:hypothetical protein
LLDTSSNILILDQPSPLRNYCSMASGSTTKHSAVGSSNKAYGREDESVIRIEAGANAAPILENWCRWTAHIITGSRIAQMLVV